MNTILYYAITIGAFLIALTFHEFCHALTAYLLGDNTAKRLGRLTLNPLAHIDPLGLLFLILVRFGWAKPVPFDPRNFSHPRLYSILVGFAGPLSNFFLALLFLYAVHYTPATAATQSFLLPFFQTSVWINVMLGVFNLIPIPPLDGSHTLAALLPESWQGTYRKFAQLGFFLLIILLMIPAIQKAFLATIIITIGLLDHFLVF